MITNLLTNYTEIILSVITGFLSFTFILDGFKFSDIKFIKYSQYFMLASIFLYIYLNFLSLPTVYAAEKDPSFDPVLSTNVTVNVNKDGLEKLSNAVLTLGSNIGVGTTVGGTAAAVATVLKTAPIPPMQKVGGVLFGGIVGGLIHAGVTVMNKNNFDSSSALGDLPQGSSSVDDSNSVDNSSISTPSSPSFNANSPLEVNESLFSNTNYVEDLLYIILGLNLCTLMLFIFFLLSLVNRLVLIKGLNFKITDKILPLIKSEKIKSFIDSTYKYSDRVIIFYTIYLIFFIFISCLASIYFMYELIINFEQFSRDYLNCINEHNKIITSSLSAKAIDNTPHILKNDNLNDAFIDKFKKYKTEFKTKYITPLNFKYITNLKFNPYFCTYDLETFKNDKGIATPYLFGIYIPTIGFKAFYGLDCVEKALEFILNYDYPVKKVSFFAHYAGGFDAYLIMKDIIKNKGSDKIEYLMDPGNSIFYIKFEHNNHVFEFKDSYKLMPIKLDKILKGFKIKVNESLGKLPFNHNWVNENSLDYNGKIPSWLSSYKELLLNIDVLDKDGNFNFKKYSILYNEIDTVGLHKAIEKFFRILVDNFHIDFTHCITLPQLVMELFRKRNLDEDIKIRMFSKRMQNLISKAYYGAHTAVYKPFGEKLYYYDINSLYPYCMLNTMPVGTPKKYDVNLGLKDFFGFALVKVKVPVTLNIPVLPLYVKIEGQDRLVFPTGTFKNYYFSEELKYAESLGCKIELIEAWEFQKGENVFNNYVEPLFELKRTGNKDERDVFKLCLNTLYGKWGQHREYKMNIITSDLSLMDQIEKTFTNVKQTTFDENVAGYSFDKAPNPELFKDSPDLFNELSETFEKGLESRAANIAIAAAITSYARIEIDKFKRLPGYEIYYSDTDCVILNKPLPKEYLGDALGQMKNELADKDYTIEKDHEYFLDKGIFLRDKLYSIKPRNKAPITKFSGLNKNFITEELHNTIESIYLNSGKNLTLKTEITSKNTNTFEIKNEATEKTFTFNYSKRVMIRNKDGIWIDTKPIHISSVKIQNYDFQPIIGRQNRQENLSKKVYLSYKDVKINHYNVYNTDYKKFDGFLLNYIAPIFDGKLSNPAPLGPCRGSAGGLRLSDKFLIETNDPFEKAKNILLGNLFTLAEKAIEENVLVKGIGYLISEEYITPQGVSKINTISYLNSFNSLNELINIYEQHLNGIIEGGQDSGNMIVLDDNNINKSNYNIKTLYLRILIPKDLIKDKIVPAKFLKLEASTATGNDAPLLTQSDTKTTNRKSKLDARGVFSSNHSIKRNYSTNSNQNTVSPDDRAWLNAKNCVTLVEYKNKKFLKPAAHFKCRRKFINTNNI